MATHSRHSTLEAVLISATVCLSALLLDSLLDSGTPATPASTQMFTVNIPLKAKNLRFEFAAQDGSVLLPCRHQLVGDITEDWIVTCTGPKRGESRYFSVHLWLKTFTRAKVMTDRPASGRPQSQGNSSLGVSGDSQSTYEVFYWVKDRTQAPSTPARSRGSTMRLKLNDPSDASGLDLVQEIDGNHILRARIQL